ncbi:MAG: nitrogenase iron-molybdenum cofactor biosynthesis protein NifN [Actinobacteria bacterium]|nr:nitrogenase iron-molybdenum cofactor biosynthesis protein NifN [Actinomycetota bacterium]
MMTNIEKLTEKGCAIEKKNKVCRSRGGESCAFDGAMIVLQPIADAAHIVHGPIACAGNSWEGRGTLSNRGDLHRMGFTTDMSELDIIYGSEDKLYNAIIQTYKSVAPKAIFVYATCVSGLIGEDIESICKRAEETIDDLRGQTDAVGETIQNAKSRIDAARVRVIPVNAPGFVGPKNLGNRIAGEVLLEHVIGSGEPAYTTDIDINLIGEYNIAGDQWLIEPTLQAAGIRVLSRVTGDSTFEEITYAHRAKLNVVVCGRALINVAKEMEERYGIPYVEVSFFGKTEMTRALRAIAAKLGSGLRARVESVIRDEEAALDVALTQYAHLKGKRAVLYTGGVKSWSIISALRDLGIDIVAVGTKKSTFEDEEKMKGLLGADAPLVEDVAASNLLKVMREGNADMLIAGGRNQYLAMKKGFPFVDVNQERHIAYAGYRGLVNLAEQISNSVEFFARTASEELLTSARHKHLAGHGRPRGKQRSTGLQHSNIMRATDDAQAGKTRAQPAPDVLINPLKHSPALGAAIAMQGIHSALPVIHGAQGCGFLGKVLLTKHFREPVALASTKLFTEDVVMGSDDALVKVVESFVEKNHPEVVAVLSSGLSAVKGDDVDGLIRRMRSRNGAKTALAHVSTPDYEGGLERGYAKAVEAVIEAAAEALFTLDTAALIEKQVNIVAGSHLTPADFTEIRDIVESFGLSPIILPDLAALDGSRQDFSALATGGTTLLEIRSMRLSGFTLAIGASMRPAAELLHDRFGIDFKVFEGISGLKDVDELLETLSALSGKPIPAKYERQRGILTDGLRDAHSYLSGKKACLALEPDLAVQTSRWLYETGVDVELAVIPAPAPSMGGVLAKETVVGDLFSLDGDFDVLIANSHGEDAAKRLGVPLSQTGFPVYKQLGATQRVTIGYRGTLASINDLANLLTGSRHS